MSQEDFYIYNLSEKVINSLELLYFDSKTSESVKVEDAQSEPTHPSRKSTQHDTAYYKSDLYRYNLKRKLNDLPPVTEEEFDKLLEEESIESLSGSDEEESDGDEEEGKLQNLIQKLDMRDENEHEESTVSHLNTKSPFILFGSSLVPPDKAIGAYKAVFSSSQLENPTKSFQQFSRAGKSALFMIGGGHFAGAIISHARKSIRGNAPNMKESIQEQAVDIIQSKTFHRYTTRRKQGGSQSASDNARGKANSAGSSIRRYNEQALIQEVRELLHDWKNHLQECSAIYIRANGASNRKILVGYEGSPIENNDPRLRGFPFTTRRATTSELKRAWVELTHLHVVDMPKVEKKKQKVVTSSKVVQKPTKSPEELEHEQLNSELIGLLKKQRAPKLINFVKQNKINVDELKLDYTHTPTLLHYAAANGLGHMVQVLLVNLKASPNVCNSAGRTPAEVADTTARKVFQIVRHKLGEEYCDWNAAKVGPPKSKEEIEQEEKSKNEQLELEKKKLIQEELAKKTELELKKPTFSSSGVLGKHVDDLTGLSEQQKMRLMREQRARAAEARMKRLNPT
ncbi:zinc finger-containing protein [Candida dubliniensis CD36]|uniref:Zinc finger-containing protein n=1 Tax=Candida dubliniensis (strain CD36 / ATCC MYA-646 / CBS 7987 / NCPF 3949 / NRRL Y-17841) TaxID=573826 RepID=B9WCV8_CANDC|nr:zinc finger-containing protein [Candida dubliniensis CD36]CAX44233.1 zinc finger-containing protein [Candida dubliniensis CD36]